MNLAQRIGQEFKDLRDNELSLKVDAVAGKSLSTEDYTTAEKTKLSGIEEGAQVNVPETLTSISFSNNTLSYTDENGSVNNIDLSLYLDDTNLARIVSGVYDAGTNSLVFTRDDSSTFSIDASMFFDDTNLVLSVDGQTGTVDLSNVYEPKDSTIMKEGENISLLNNDVGYITLLDLPVIPAVEEEDPIFNAWDKSTGISITESQISDLGSYLPTAGGTVTGNLTVDGVFKVENTAPHTALKDTNSTSATDFVGYHEFIDGNNVRVGLIGISSSTSDAMNISNVTGGTLNIKTVDTTRISIGTTRITLQNILKLNNIPTYADDTAAGNGGLTVNDVYKTATGELRIKL
jgi:hypothetical protein